MPRGDRFTIERLGDGTVDVRDGTRRIETGVGLDEAVQACRRAGARRNEPITIIEVDGYKTRTRCP